jgi:hypothetical protein
MVTKKVLVLCVLGAFACGAAAGGAYGVYRGFRAGVELVLNQALEKDAREVSARIAVLRDLRKDGIQLALRKLETGLDDTLVTFDPDVPFSGLEPRTIAALRKAIADAKDYRAVFPWPDAENNFRAKMVRSLFARDLYK